MSAAQMCSDCIKALEAENEAILHFDPIHNVIRRAPLSLIRENYRRMQAEL